MLGSGDLGVGLRRAIILSRCSSRATLLLSFNVPNRLLEHNGARELIRSLTAGVVEPVNWSPGLQSRCCCCSNNCGATARCAS